MPARNHVLMMVLSLCLCVPAAGSGVTLSLSSDGRFFTIDGTPTYLNGVSYYAGTSIWARA